MKTIFQNCEVAFNAVQIQDAMVVSKLMDALRDSYINRKYDKMWWDLSKEERELYKSSSKHNCDVHLSVDQLENIFNTLVAFGFCCSDGGTILPDVELIKKEG